MSRARGLVRVGALLGLGFAFARVGALLGLGFAVAAAADEIGDRPRAAGGVRLIEAMEASGAAAVVLVREVRSLGGSGWAGRVRVENPVVGDAAIGTELAIAWEELAASRAPRLAKGERALVVLEPLPGASIWLSRIPDPKQRSATLAIAMRGDAFLREPALGTTALLEHYLALTPEDRAGPSGVAYLADLASLAELPLAIDAVARLDTREDLDEKLAPASARALVGALVRRDATPRLEDALVELIGRHQLEATRPALESLTGSTSPAPPAVYAALARIGDGLSAEQTRRLLELGPVRYREVVARHAGGPAAARELRRLMRRDPAAEVRIGAIERLVELEGEQGIEAVSETLADPDPTVRASAARSLGSLGEPAVPELRRVAEGEDLDAARAAIAGLAVNESAASGAALRELAAQHPDESIRRLAGLALGQAIGDAHD